MGVKLGAESEDDARMLARRINRRYVGVAPIAVQQTDEAVIISIRDDKPANQTGGMIIPTFPVQIRRDGGNDGNQSAQCTITYSLFPIGATASTPPLATGVTPEKSRSSLGRYIQAPDDSIGLAYYKTGGGYGLMVAWKEVEFAELCQ